MSEMQKPAGKPVGATILGGFFGLLAGAGFGIYLAQAGVLSMTSKLSLLVPLAGLVVGVLAGVGGGRRPKKAKTGS